VRLRPGGERRLSEGLLVRSAFVHEQTARRLVHALKYRGLVAAAEVLAVAMAPLLDPGTRVLVPVPRTISRRWRYGVDSGLELAEAVGRRTGLPVVRALRAGWWHRARAAPRDAIRGHPRFRPVVFAGPGAMLIDDVLTTGATLTAARRTLQCCSGALTATAAVWDWATGSNPTDGRSRRYSGRTGLRPIEHGSDGAGPQPRAASFHSS
jgi:predicted amidophosphoribosyltransferase